MFSGSEEQGLGETEEARSAYERAAALYPTAQSPLLALAQLARKEGNQPEASAAMRRLWALGDPAKRLDPWPVYYLMQGGDAEPLLRELYRRVSLEAR
jgi:hypothetical protein